MLRKHVAKTGHACSTFLTTGPEGPEGKNPCLQQSLYILIHVSWPIAVGPMRKNALQGDDFIELKAVTSHLSEIPSEFADH